MEPDNTTPTYVYGSSSLQELKEYVERQRENALAAKNTDRGRFWAIFVTELDKVYALAYTYGLNVNRVIPVDLTAT